MPEVVADSLIDCARSLSRSELFDLMQSTFISYGAPDEDFAEKLHQRLTAAGVRTFFFPLHAAFGQKLHDTMRQVDKYDRVILVCSRHSLNRTGVQFEIEKTLEREARDGGASYLIPVSLDGFVFDGWHPPREGLRTEVLNRVVADSSDPMKYERQMSRLLSILRKESRGVPWK